MDDATATHLAGLKRKRAALLESGADDRAAELANTIRALEESDPLPNAPRLIPSPKAEAPKVAETPQHAEPKPQVRRTGRPAK